jgi:hypothetical protein
MEMHHQLDAQHGHGIRGPNRQRHFLTMDGAPDGGGNKPGT